jgi:hypothetical protein
MLQDISGNKGLVHAGVFVCFKRKEVVVRERVLGLYYSPR